VEASVICNLRICEHITCIQSRIQIEGVFWNLLVEFNMTRNFKAIPTCYGWVLRSNMAPRAAYDPKGHFWTE